ncbi:hypothetical protein [Rhodococcus sp. BE178]|uniref:hypothetical protein n=1 Tax=Rhodococcus sp. BE178 TaxID=2817737 RepID=UPI003D1B5FDE
MSDRDIISTFENNYLDIEEIPEEPYTRADAEGEWFGAQVRNANANIESMHEPKRQRREAAEREKADQEARRVAAGGGEKVTTELRGEIGQAVDDVMRLDRIAETARKVEHRITEETREMLARAIEDRDEELFSAAWDAAASKTKVPPIVAPAWEWTSRDVPTSPGQNGPGVRWTAERLLERLRKRQAVEMGARVAEVLPDVDRVLVETAENILTAAGSAADTLTGAGLTVDATAEDVIAHGGSEVIAAFKAWGQAVAAWGDVQSVRRWVAVAAELGFSETNPERLAYGEGVADLEARVWGSQFEGAGVPVGGVAGALSWWVGNGRPAPIGVGGNEKAGAVK